MATFDYVIFENTKVTFPSNLVLIFSAIRHNSSALFLAQTLYTLVTRSQLKSIFGCLSQNSLNSSFQFWNENSSFQFKNDKSIPLQILHYFSMSWHIIHLEILILLWTEGSHQSPNFDTFKCPGENLPDFSCYFSNHRSVFLQNIRNSSESWKITPLYFCSFNIIYFDHREPIKTQIF